MTDLTQVTTEFGIAYDEAKDAETDKKTKQTSLFEAFTERLEHSTLAERIVDLPADTETPLIVNEWIKTYHPGWRFVGMHEGRVIIEEDPALLKDTFVNPEDGRVYGRTTAQGSPNLDDDRLRAEQPELWEAISVWPEPWVSLVRGAMGWVNQYYGCAALGPFGLEDFVNAYLQEQNVQRVLIDPAQLTEEDFEALQEYLVPGPVSVRLVPPRLATEEELEAA